MNITHDPKYGHHYLAGKSVLLHCNHYNVELQNTILLPDYIDGYTIQFNAAAEMSLQMLGYYFPVGPSSVSMEKIIEKSFFLYGTMGLGKLSSLKVDNKQATFEIISSHYQLGWKIRFGNFIPQSQVLSMGFIAGMMSFIFAKKYQCSYQKQEGKHVLIAAEDNNQSYSLINSSHQKILFETKKIDNDYHGIPCKDITENILASLPYVNTKGLIEAFGVYLTYLPAEYYANIAYNFENTLNNHGGIKGLARPLLIESGHICGFHTFGGIMKSEIWQSVIQPMLNVPEDWVYGIVAVINALGWGNWHIKELLPSHKLTLQVYGSTEAIGYISHFGQADEAKCYTAEGAAAAIMNLIYKGNIIDGPELNSSYYKQVFRDKNAFISKETKCLAKGDPYCEFEFQEK